MTVNEIRNSFCRFFETKQHSRLPSSSLIPKDDPSVLVTTAGMQQFKKWFSGEMEPASRQVITIQKCLRTNDIEEVGETPSHLTFFEMLGNFSFGGYFKEESIRWALEFIEKELRVDRMRLWISIFEGDNEVPRDEESVRIWQELGISDIRFFGREDNFWGPTGDEGVCGPTTEIYLNDVEIWNIVFNEYYLGADGALTPLKVKGVDTGAGLERVSATINGLKSVFETDELVRITALVEKEAKKKDPKAVRIITDHLRATVFLLADGIRPSNLDRGYVLRRLIRRAVRYAKLIGIEENAFFTTITDKVIDIYGTNYQNLSDERTTIISEVELEVDKFRAVIDSGLARIEKLSVIDGHEAFLLFATYGLPLELTIEIAKEKKIRLTDDIKAVFEADFEKHQQVSRGGLEKKFTGGLESKEDPLIIRYHTAAHLLDAALREVLGEHVHQKGSNITAERIRFDFTHTGKMTDDEKRAVEELINQWIDEKLVVTKTETNLEAAKKYGALGEFSERYGEKISVYTIGGDLESKKAISKEICGGPHAQNTGELGKFVITKEESSSAGVRRIKAILK